MSDYSSIEAISNALIEITESISDHGIMVTLSALMVIVFIIILTIFVVNNYKQSKATITQNNNLIEELSNQNRELTKMVNDLYAQTASLTINQPPYSETNIVDIFLELNGVLKSVCKKTQESLQTGRSAIYVFHNGASASHGLPFFKMSCVSEWVPRGGEFTAKMREETNLPLSLFSIIVQNIKETDTVIEYDQDTMPLLDPMYYNWMVLNGIGKCFIKGIYSQAESSPMGYIIIEYSDDEDSSVNVTNESIIKELNEAAIKCVPVLEFSEYRKMRSDE